MAGHNDTVTGMSLSPDGAHVLTNSMDNTLRVWDIRPYASKERCVKLFTGHLHNFEKVKVIFVKIPLDLWDLNSYLVTKTMMSIMLTPNLLKSLWNPFTNYEYEIGLVIKG